MRSVFSMICSKLSIISEPLFEILKPNIVILSTNVKPRPIIHGSNLPVTSPTRSTQVFSTLHICPLILLKFSRIFFSASKVSYSSITKLFASSAKDSFLFVCLRFSLLKNCVPYNRILNLRLFGVYRFYSRIQFNFPNAYLRSHVI